MLLERARNGDRRAFEELVSRYDRQIFRLAYYKLGDFDQAREVYQETFLKAYRSIGRFCHQSSFFTWLYQIGKNACIDHLRRQQRFSREISLESDRASDPDAAAPIEFLGSDSPEQDPERVLYSTEMREAVREALARLTGKERLVFELRHYHGLRLRAVGEAAGMTEVTAKNYLFRGTQKMRAALSAFRASTAV